jgi:hypothetical protein
MTSLPHLPPTTGKSPETLKPSHWLVPTAYNFVHEFLQFHRSIDVHPWIPSNATNFLKLGHRILPRIPFPLPCSPLKVLFQYLMDSNLSGWDLELIKPKLRNSGFNF